MGVLSFKYILFSSEVVVEDYLLLKELIQFLSYFLGLLEFVSNGGVSCLEVVEQGVKQFEVFKVKVELSFFGLLHVQL